jgi:hypothetical protein
MRIELEYAYDRTLREQRLEHYQKLFYVSRRLPRHWAPHLADQLTRQDAARLREEFHDWYFGEPAGGMFLTSAAKHRYMTLANALTEASGDQDEQADVGTESLVPSEDHKRLRELASDLRHQLAEDVGAAHPPRLRWYRPERTVRPPWWEPSA